MKALIIDNDSSVRVVLNALLGKLCPQITSVTEATGVISGLNAIASHKPDLVFLDVEMDDGTGFDLIQKLGTFDFQLVFITAFNKYAVKAFRLSAIDFLLKPIDPTDLVVAVNKALSQIKSRSLEGRLKLLEESLKEAEQDKKDLNTKVALYDGNTIHYVKINDILYCKADGSYTHFYLLNKIKIMVSRILKEYEDILSEYGFVRTHHSYLVNTSKIQRFDKSEGGQLFLEGDYAVPVSTRKREHVLEILSKT